MSGVCVKGLSTLSPKYILLIALALAAPAAPAPSAGRDGRADPSTIAAVPRSQLDPAWRQPFVEYEAEAMPTDGRILGPDRRLGTLAAEASGRRAVLLSGPGQGIAFRLGAPANAVVVRYAIPDSADGTGRDGSIGIFVDGKRIARLAVTSRFGWFYGRYPFTNNPADGHPHHFFDHARLLLDRTLAAGTVVRLAFEPGDSIEKIAIDLADFEMVAPGRPAPARAISLTAFGGDPSGAGDSTGAFTRAVAAARAGNHPLWIPPGRFRVNGHVMVDQVEIAGAGLWRSTLFGHRIGLYGKVGGGMARRVRLHDFAIIGDVTERIDNDQVNAIGGAMGDGSRIERLWLQHTKVGLWFDGPMRGITVSGLRIVDMAADGLNFHRGVSDAVVEKSFVRGTGDDGIASWAGGGQNSNIIVRDNVVIAPVLANGIAIYGGRDIRVERNLVADTLTEGGGIHVGNRFGAVPVTGRVDIDDNLIVRGGSIDPRWRFGVGALWFYALDAPIEASIQVRRLRIWNSSAETILMMGSRVTGVSIDGLAGEPPVIATRAAGQARISGLARGAVMIHRDCAPGFRLELAPGTMRGATGAAACDRSVEDTDAVSIGW